MHAVLSGLPHWAEVYEKWTEHNSMVILFLPPRGGWGSQCLLCGLASHTQTHEDKEMPWTVGVSCIQTSSLSCVLTIHGTHSWLRFICRVLTWHGWSTLLQLTNTVWILFKPILGQTHDLPSFSLSLAFMDGGQTPLPHIQKPNKCMSDLTGRTWSSMTV